MIGNRTYTGAFRSHTLHWAAARRGKYRGNGEVSAAQVRRALSLLGGAIGVLGAAPYRSR